MQAEASTLMVTLPEDALAKWLAVGRAMKREAAATTPEEKVLLIDDALERLRAQDPERGRVVLMKFFGGLTNQEVAESMGVTERTIERHWAYAKAWLFQSIREQQLGGRD